MNRSMYFISFTGIVVSLAVTLALCLMLTVMVSPSDYSVDIEQIFSVEIEGNFQPESTEKLLYMLSLILFPTLFLLVVHICTRLERKYKWIEDLHSSVILNNLSYIIMVIVILYLLWFDLNKVDYFYAKFFLLYENPFLTFLFIMSLVGLSVLKKRIDQRFEIQSVTNGIFQTVLGVSVWTSIFLLGIMNVIDILYITDGVMFTSHFNAVFHSVATVVSGKYLLVNEFNQYGLYPHFIEPIFRVVDLSVSSFTWTMSLLIMVTWICWYLVLKKIMLNYYILIAGFYTLLFFGYIQAKLRSEDSYFQYFPIRSLFPALLICMATYYFISKTRWKYFLIHVISAISVLWNLETGTIVMITWIGTLIFDDICRKVSVKKWFIHVVYSAIAFICVMGGYSFYIWLRSGFIPDFLQLSSYIQYFYEYGFYMLPMTLFHPWNLVAIIYMIGIVVSLIAMYNRQQSFQNTMIFAISIMGCGLFSYYQGRSHDVVLNYAWYPSFVLLAIFADRWWHQSRDRKITLQFILALVLVGVMASSIFSVFYYYKNIIDRTVQRWSADESSSIETRTEFIKNWTFYGEEELFLSYHSGIYYSTSKTVPVVDIPGPSEAFLIKDQNIIMEHIKSRASDQIFFDKNFLSLEYSKESNLKILNTLLEYYSVVDKSDDKNLFRFIPRTEVASTTKVSKILTSSAKNSIVIHYSIKDNLWIYNNENHRVIGMVGSSLPEITLGDTEFTIEALLKPTELQVPYAVIVGNHPGYTNLEGFVIQKNGDAGNSYMFTYGDGQAWMEPIIFTLNENEWNYISVGYDNGDIQVYINGVLYSSTKFDMKILNTGFPLILGDWISKDRTFSGEIKEVRILDNRISEQEVLINWGRLENIE
jgi:uncharacterized membrane protein (UPF0136 family)